MCPDMQAEVITLESHGNLLHPSGSRLICPHVVTAESDFDVYCMGDERQAAERIMGGFHGPGTKGGEYRNSISLKKPFPGGIFNLIVFFEAGPYQRFYDATRFCAELGGPEDKATRMKVFKVFLGYETPASGEPQDEKIRMYKKMLQQWQKLNERFSKEQEVAIKRALDNYIYPPNPPVFIQATAVSASTTDIVFRPIYRLSTGTTA